MQILFVCFILCYAVIYNVTSQDVYPRVLSYFNSTTVQSFHDTWRRYKTPIEDSIEFMLRETYSADRVNIYIWRGKNPLKISDGFFVSDNMAKVLFKDLYLTHLPHLRSPKVSFALHANVLRVDASISKMFIEADYALFRNLSNVVYSAQRYDPYLASPFSLPEVSNTGVGTILAEGCFLAGYVVTSLTGESVSLGHDTFHLSKCEFSVEISTRGTGAPPVIAPYFSKEQAKKLETILMKPIRDELLPKLQGAMFTYVNTSSLLGAFLPKWRQEQQKIFKQSLGFMRKVALHLNKQCGEEISGVGRLKDETFSWTDKYDGAIQDLKVSIVNVTLSGLDSAYSAQTGGPLKKSNVSIEDAIRFATLQVRGTLYFTKNETETVYVFYGEIQDATFYSSLGTKKSNSASMGTNELPYVGWRRIDLHLPWIELIASKALVTGYLLDKLPSFMMTEMTRFFNDAVAKAKQEANNANTYKEHTNNDDDNRETDKSEPEGSNNANHGRKESVIKPVIKEPMFKEYGNQEVNDKFDEDNEQDNWDGGHEGGSFDTGTGKIVTGEPLFKGPMFDFSGTLDGDTNDDEDNEQDMGDDRSENGSDEGGSPDKGTGKNVNGKLLLKGAMFDGSTLDHDANVDEDDGQGKSNGRGNVAEGSERNENGEPILKEAMFDGNIENDDQGKKLARSVNFKTKILNRRDLKYGLSDNEIHSD